MLNSRPKPHESVDIRSSDGVSGGTIYTLRSSSGPNDITFYLLYPTFTGDGMTGENNLLFTVTMTGGE